MHVLALNVSVRGNSCISWCLCVVFCCEEEVCSLTSSAETQNVSLLPLMSLPPSLPVVWLVCMFMVLYVWLKKASGIRLTSSPQRWKIHKVHTHAHTHTHTHVYLQTDKKRCRRQTCLCAFVYVTLRGHVYPPSASRCCTNALYHSTKARPQAFM